MCSCACALVVWPAQRTDARIGEAKQGTVARNYYSYDQHAPHVVRVPAGRGGVADNRPVAVNWIASSCVVGAVEPNAGAQGDHKDAFATEKQTCGLDLQ